MPDEILAPTVGVVADAGTDAQGDETRATVRRGPAKGSARDSTAPFALELVRSALAAPTSRPGDEPGLTVAARVDRVGFHAWSDPASATTFRVGGDNDGFLAEAPSTSSPSQ